uniref:(northern house mosquito) hypothetical protein n=1 Tax=Culex pipiens TaxID=7175 RepID=A0A8D8J0I7_CULPI
MPSAVHPVGLRSLSSRRFGKNCTSRPRSSSVSSARMESDWMLVDTTPGRWSREYSGKLLQIRVTVFRSGSEDRFTMNSQLIGSICRTDSCSSSCSPQNLISAM